MSVMEGIRYRRASWIVWRFWKDDDGRTDDAKVIGGFWNESEAVAEASRLNESNTDPAVWYEVIETEASGVYPADENPPWVPDPERLTRRGYERQE
jgi:hypothetical protein